MEPIDHFAEKEVLPAISWREARVGTQICGTVCGDITMAQQRHYETGELLTWPDGNPRMNIIIPLRLESGEARSLWVKKPSKLFAALQHAQKAGGGKPIAPGGLLRVTMTGAEPHTNPRLNPFKCFTATYTPPVSVSAWDLSPEESPVTEPLAQPLQRRITLLMQDAGLTNQAIAEAWQRWEAKYREFTPAVFTMIYDELRARQAEEQASAETREPGDENE